MTASRNRRAIRAVPVGRYALLSIVAAIGLLAGGCRGIREKAPPRPQPQAPEAAESAEFTIADNANDTWNTVGQILLRLDRVEYESRAQMLGIYALRYRGERLLIRTQAVVMDSVADGMRTRVLALHPDGKPNNGPAAVELLGVLKQRLPLEIEKYRKPIELKKAKKPKKKRKSA